jgi:anti-sigma regulatory factor (Ser/Thr protein kinase)
VLATRTARSPAPISLLIPGGPTAARQARRVVLERLGEHVSNRVADDLGVVISELVTNSVVHAEIGPGRYLHVSVGVLQARLLVAVSDRGSLSVPRLSASRDVEVGLGLRLVDRLAYSWGVARDGTGRTQVWCELRR